MQTTDDTSDKWAEFLESKNVERQKQIWNLTRYLFHCLGWTQLKDIAEEVKGYNWYKHDQQLLRDLNKLCDIGMLKKEKRLIKYKRSPQNKKKENTFYKINDNIPWLDYKKYNIEKLRELSPVLKDNWVSDAEHQMTMGYLYRDMYQEAGIYLENRPENYVKDKLMPVKEELEYYFYEILLFHPETKGKITVEWGRAGVKPIGVNVVEIPLQHPHPDPQEWFSRVKKRVANDAEIP